MVEPVCPLAERRERPASCAGAGAGGGEPGAVLNNMDTLRSYGSAGDELEGIPPDYLRNLNIDPADRKPWSEQMHLHTFVDNKIYNGESAVVGPLVPERRARWQLATGTFVADLKGCKGRARATSPSAARRMGAGVGAGAAGGDLVGGYHWDCSDWCGGGALPGISEVAGSERPDSSSPPTPPSPPLRASPRRVRRRPPPDTDSAPDDLDRDTDPPRYTDGGYLSFAMSPSLARDACSPNFSSSASSYLLHPDEYLPRAASDSDTAQLRARIVREPDAASLITMLGKSFAFRSDDERYRSTRRTYTNTETVISTEERNSLLDGGDAGSCSDLSTNLCEIEESEDEAPPVPGLPVASGTRHTDV